MCISVWILSEPDQIHLIGVNRILGNTLITLTINFDPALFFGFSAADFCNEFTNALLHFSEVDFFLESHGTNEFKFRCAILSISLALISQFNHSSILAFKFDVALKGQRIHYSIKLLAIHSNFLRKSI